MLKLNAGFSRKIGEPSFGSRGASVNVELELDSNLIRDPDTLCDRIRNLFDLARRSVDDELALDAGPVERDSDPAQSVARHTRVAHPYNVFDFSVRGEAVPEMRDCPRPGGSDQCPVRDRAAGKGSGASRAVAPAPGGIPTGAGSAGERARRPEAGIAAPATAVAGRGYGLNQWQPLTACGKSLS